MDREVAHARGMAGAEDALAAREGFVLAYTGRLVEAKTKGRLAVDLSMQANQPGRAALFQTGVALWDALFGNASTAVREAAAALALSTDRDLEYGAAFALALAGDMARSTALVDDLERRFPQDTEVRFVYVPAIRALQALHGRDSAKAIELLRVALPYDLAAPLSMAPGYFGAMYARYVRGLALLAAHQDADAAAEFQSILDHRGLVASDPVGALAHLQLGRAFAASGDRAKARTAYNDFLSLWKDADAAIPILDQARAEFAKLP
jgi:tetratricopeptide (TPR) repeat protein